jgi:Bacterial Ig domain
MGDLMIRNENKSRGRQFGATLIVILSAAILICSCGDSTDPIDKTAPEVLITSPAEGGLVVGDTLITATATDDTGVTEVTFYYDTTQLGTDTQVPYEQALTFDGIPEGYDGEPEAHLIVVTAKDAAGNVSIPDSVSFNLQLPIPDTTAPVVSLTTPIADADISGRFSFTADATDGDDGTGISEVIFFIDEFEVARTTATPYAAVINTLPYADGATHTIGAAAVDSAGNTGNAPTVSVTISEGAQVYLVDFLELASAGSYNEFEFDRLVDLDPEIEYLLDESLIITADTCIRGNGAVINCLSVGNIRILPGPGSHPTRFNMEFCQFGYGGSTDKDFSGVIEFKSGTNGWLRNNTFYENEPAAVFVQFTSFDFDLQFVNNLFYSNESGLVRVEDEGQDLVLDIFFNCSAGNRIVNYGEHCGCPTIPQPYEMDADELHPSNLQVYPEIVHVWERKQPYWDFRLLPGSPCIGSGENGSNMGALPVAQ